MEKEIISVIKYFSFFAYQPTLEEIHTFLQAKISKNELKKKLNRIVRQKKLLASEDTPPQYGMGRKISNIKYQISKNKLQNWRFKIYTKILTVFSQIKLVGLSGSIAMMNADLDDDIDLFIITAKNRLFTARFLATMTAFIMGLKRGIGLQKAPKKVCLNLFFDENDLRVPKFKQTEYVAHEVLQMKPVINKDRIYERFLEANLWIQDIFPNSSWIISKIKYQKSKTSLKFKSFSFKLGFDILTLIFKLPTRLFEKVIKSFQLTFINRHKTTEIITSTQLWFHPDDFEKKIKKLGRTTASVG